MESSVAPENSLITRASLVFTLNLQIESSAKKQAVIIHCFCAQKLFDHFHQSNLLGILFSIIICPLFLNFWVASFRTVNFFLNTVILKKVCVKYTIFNKVIYL